MLVCVIGLEIMEQLPNVDEIYVVVYNLLGKKVLFAKNTHSVDVKELSNGVYFIRISDGLHQTIKRFVKN